MAILTFGINHKTAPVDIRERVAFPERQLPDALQRLARHTDVDEAAILSTCNRTEIYCGLPEANAAPVIDWLCHYHDLRPELVQPYLYTYPDRSAVRHMFRVASGLDSMVLGEPQILGQMKTAYGQARGAGTLGSTLERLFQHTFQVAKQVRTDTAIGSSPVSVAFAAVRLAQQIFGALNGQTAMLVGAGETIELAARHLRENDIGDLIIANRTRSRAQALVHDFGGHAISLADLPEALQRADIVITSTGSTLPILGKGTVERAVKARRRRPIFMVDIAVPRDVEPEVGSLSDVYLYTVDDLAEMIDAGRESRQAAALQAEEIIEQQIARFMGWLKAREATDVIRDYRERAENYKTEVLNRARRRLAAGDDPAQVMEALAHTLTNKLLHDPSVQLREASREGRRELLAAARELFNLDDNSGNS